MKLALAALLATLSAATGVRATPERANGDDTLVELALASGAPWTLPSTGLSALAEGAWVGTSGLDGAAAGLRLRASWAPTRWFELGAEVGADGWSLGADGLGASRVGLSTLALSMGVGTAIGRAAEAVRVIAGVGPSAFGLDALDVADRRGLVALRVDGVFLGGQTDLRLQLDLGFAFGPGATAFGGVQADVVLGRRASSVRLVAGASERAGGPRLATAAHAGVVVALGPTARLRATVSVPVLSADPFGRRVWMALSFVTVAAGAPNGTTSPSRARRVQRASVAMPVSSSCCGPSARGASGSHTRMRAPPPSRVEATASPPCARASSRTSAKPSPVPTT